MNHDIVIAASQHGWAWSDLWSLISALSAVAGVLILAWYTYYTRKLLESSQESLEHARASGEVAARPWILALTIDGPKQVVHTTETILSVYFKFKNTGVTPAIIQSSAASWELSDRSQSKKFELSEQAAGNSGPAICPPGDFFHLPIHAHLPAGITLEMMSERRLILIVHGEVIYSDCFDKRHSTKFGMQYGRFYHDSDTPDWQACGEYNAIT